MKLLSRDDFRNNCLKRDNSRCVICQADKNPAVHHILERRLWSDGGYYMDNGATLCETCHLSAESTELSCEEIRAAARIKGIVLPDHLYSDHKYTKWGDVILDNGRIMPGELFDDPSVQKIIKTSANFLKYTRYIKYPRTYHVPWSEGATSDDKIIGSCDHFKGKQVVISSKLDGENSTLYNDYIHARSIDGRDHWSRSWLKNLHSKIKHEIPETFRICGENLFAKHSIGYDNLESYFYVFSIWDGLKCLSWDETVSYCEILGLSVVPVIYQGEWDEEKVQKIAKELDKTVNEGYVVRTTGEFHYKDFSSNLVKFVRANHVSPDNHHWMFTATEKNKLKIN